MSDYFNSYAVNQNIIGDSKLAVNQLPVSLLDFALISGMRNRVYGVRVFGDEECGDATCCLNDVARQSIWRILFNVQQNLMARKRITAGIAYFQETKLIDSLTSVIRTSFGAVEKVDVKQEFVFVANLMLSPYIVEDVVLQTGTNGVEAVFSSTIVDNPNRVILRDPQTLEQYSWDRSYSLAHYPARDGYEWVMLCPQHIQVDDQLSLQHYDYMIAELDVVSGISIDDLVVLHPSTYQILPFAKPPEEVISDGVMKWRFWFYSWTLTKPEFDNDPPDLVAGEFHKLYATLELFRKTEVEAVPYAKVQSYENCTNEMEIKTVNGSCEIIDSFAGMVKFTEIANDTIGKRYNLHYYYKVNPLSVENIFMHSTEELKRAIVAKTAATIDLESCGCLLPQEGNPLSNYITKMQQTYTKEYISPITGAVAVNYLYGNKHGDLLFAEMMKSLTFRPKGFMA